MLAGLSSPEVGELLAYYRSEPFGELRADLRAGYRTFLDAQAARAEDPKSISERLLNFFKGIKRGR